MAIAPHQLAAFAGKNKKQNQIEDDDEEIDEVDTAADDEDLEAEEGEEGEGEEGEGEGEEEIDVDAIAKQIEDGEWPDEDLMAKAAEVNEENNPPSWALDEATWEKAKEAVEPNWDSYDEPYAVVSAVYQKMGGVIE